MKLKKKLTWMGLEREQAIREKYTLAPEQFPLSTPRQCTCYACAAHLKEALAKAVSKGDN